MSEKHYWFGYFEAGEKSSPVLRDSRIDTGNPDTLYLFNLKRNEILEYRREIIEPKLRELNAGEQGVSQELQAAYAEARGHFTPRGGKIANLPLKGRSKPPVAANDSNNDMEKEAEEFVDDDDIEWNEEEA